MQKLVSFPLFLCGLLSAAWTDLSYIQGLMMDFCTSDVRFLYIRIGREIVA